MSINRPTKPISPVYDPTAEVTQNGIAWAKKNRKLVRWNIPKHGLIDMYINPQSMRISERKLIKEIRTKGGYLIQYWGDELPQMDLSGVTGSGGIEAINILRDIYNHEQISFRKIIKGLNKDLLSETASKALDLFGVDVNSAKQKDGIAPINQLDNKAVAKTVVNFAADPLSFLVPDPNLLPTLATLAASVELWYDGMIYRGFFREFSVDEKSDEVGLFRYSMKFTITRSTGVRYNGYAWQRSAKYGPADADVVPLSFGNLIDNKVKPTDVPSDSIWTRRNEFTDAVNNTANEFNKILNDTGLGDFVNKVK